MRWALALSMSMTLLAAGCAHNEARHRAFSDDWEDQSKGDRAFQQRTKRIREGSLPMGIGERGLIKHDDQDPTPPPLTDDPGLRKQDPDLDTGTSVGPEFGYGFGGGDPARRGDR